MTGPEIKEPPRCSRCSAEPKLVGHHAGFKQRPHHPHV